MTKDSSSIFFGSNNRFPQLQDMIGKMKQWLGIEGVKMSISIPERIPAQSRVLEGVLLLQGTRAEKVSHIALRLKEQFQRGRWKEKRISEFVLGEMHLEGPFVIEPGVPLEVPFSLPFERMLSDMDRIEDQNLAFRALVGAAKWLKGVESVYWLEAESRVKGTVMDAFVKKFITIG